nr:VacJ family lipoprotein [Lentibacter algarum]
MNVISAVLISVTLAGCNNPGAGHDPALAFDPFEERNRNNHELNKSIDRAVVRPAGNGYVKIIPKPVQKGVSNFSANLGMPSLVVNNLLQGRIGDAGKNTLRFALNTTIGLGGLVDAAGEFKLEEADTDFGETLHVWGVREGAYVELPVLGPSTERDAVGKVVDLFTNPLSYVLPSPEKYIGTGASLAARLGDRGTYADTLDALLYESADSYSQARAIYIQNRRFELGEDAAEVESDPFDLNTEGF